MDKAIDFHVHIFPDSIAQKATDHVGEYYGIRMQGNGSVNQALEDGKEANLTKMVVFSAATKPEQVQDINQFIAENQKNHLEFFGFGTVHARQENIEEEVERIMKLGLHGIKIHPDFQGFSIDDTAMYPVYDAAQGRLPILFHMGDAHSDLSQPRRLRKIMELFPKLTVVAAHMGGYLAWDQAREYLYGTRAYLDTSSTLICVSPEKMKDMIRLHDSQRILFGSDYPLLLPSYALQQLKALHLAPSVWDKIVYQNAGALLERFS